MKRMCSSGNEGSMQVKAAPAFSNRELRYIQVVRALREQYGDYALTLHEGRDTMGQPSAIRLIFSVAKLLSRRALLRGNSIATRSGICRAVRSNTSWSSRGVGSMPGAVCRCSRVLSVASRRARAIPRLGSIGVIALFRRKCRR